MKKFEELLDPARMKEFIWPNFIAGGALRDSWFGKEMVDVDWFIGIYRDTFEECGKCGKFTITTGSVRYGAEYGLVFENNGTSFVPGSDFISGICKDMPGLNVILLPWDEDNATTTSESSKALAEKIIDTFPVSISQIAYIPATEEWVIHDEFKKTLDTGVLTAAIGARDVENYMYKIYPKYYDIFGNGKNKWR